MFRYVEENRHPQFKVGENYLNSFNVGENYLNSWFNLSDEINLTAYMAQRVDI